MPTTLFIAPKLLKDVPPVHENNRILRIQVSCLVIGGQRFIPAAK
jgi:hypothetical protein